MTKEECLLPTKYPPGSKGKIKVLTYRASHGVALFNAKDSRISDDDEKRLSKIIESLGGYNEENMEKGIEELCKD